LVIDQRIVAIIIAALIAPIFWWGLSNLDKTKRLWITLLISFGTVLWFLASVGSSWYFAQIVGLVLASAAVLVAIKKKNPWLASLLFGLATLARLSLIPGFIFFPLFFARQLKDHKTRYQTIVKLLMPFALLVGVYLGYNYARFGTIANVAYTDRVGLVNEPWFQNGLMHPAYIFRHLNVLFLQLPRIIPKSPWLVPDFYGLSIWFTMPALFLVFRAGFRKKTFPFWIAAVAVLLTNMLHGGVGFSQFGYRYLVDSFPFLIPLLANAIEKRFDLITKALIIISIAFNLWGVITINFLHAW